MYNAELKTEFLQQHTSSIESIKRVTGIFNQLESFESKFGKDLSQFNLDELQEAINGVIMTRVAGRWSKLSHIRSYLKWCVRNKKPGAVYNLDLVEIDGTDKFRQNFVVSPLELHKVLNAMLAPEEDHKVDNLIRAYAWLGFCRVPFELLDTLTKDNLNFETMTISFGESEQFKSTIPPLAIASLRDAANLTEFYHDHKHYQNMIPRFEGVTILRQSKSEYNPERYKEYLMKKWRAAKAAGKPYKSLSYGRLYISGWFHWMYEQEMSGYELNFASIVAEKLEREGRPPYKHKASFRNEIVSMEHDYNEWKGCFKLN